uniref:Secreted protein n=2 Tax=Opuntia streptacantha TaxID=393608 RepID=A0A7C8Z051_OPUST
MKFLYTRLSLVPARAFLLFNSSCSASYTCCLTKFPNSVPAVSSLKFTCCPTAGNPVINATSKTENGTSLLPSLNAFLRGTHALTRASAKFRSISNVQYFSIGRKTVAITASLWYSVISLFKLTTRSNVHLPLILTPRPFRRSRVPPYQLHHHLSPSSTTSSPARVQPSSARCVYACGYVPPPANLPPHPCLLILLSMTPLHCFPLHSQLHPYTHCPTSPLNLVPQMTSTPHPHQL